MLLLGGLLLVQSGCATREKKPKDKDKPAAVAPRPVYVGTISLVNAESGFVLIDGGLLPTPAPNLELRSLTNGAESAVLVTSHVSKRPFVIADIKSGTPLKGDRVFTALPGSAAPKVSPPPPSAAPVTPEPAPEFLPDIQLSPGP